MSRFVENFNMFCMYKSLAQKLADDCKKNPQAPERLVGKRRKINKGCKGSNQ